MRSLRAPRAKKKSATIITPPPAADDPTTQYALDVVAGKIVAGELVRYACERHLRDQRDGGKRGLYWAPERAREVLDFFPAVLTITAGPKQGSPFHPLAWHTFATGSLYGWRRADGQRRFRSAYVEAGKGSAKSPWMAALGIYELAFAGVSRSEVYAIANLKDQANVLFSDAVAMAKADMPGREAGESLHSLGLLEIRGTGAMAWAIEHLASGSFFKPIASGDSLSGPKPRLVLADEIHEWKTATAIEVWQAAIVKMAGDPLMILGTNTPSADQMVGTEYSEVAQSIVKGVHLDDTAFAYIARTDPTDDPMNDETCWQKSLPALGITYPVENIRGQVESAKLLPSRRAAVMRLYFGVPIGSSSAWIDEGAWNSCLGSFSDDDVAGWECYLGLDLSQRVDLTALAAVFRKPGTNIYRAKVWYWKPAGTVAAAEAEDKAPYRVWIESGLLNAVPGMTIDKTYVAAQVQRLISRYNVVGLAFDNAFFNDFRDAAREIGLETWDWAGPDSAPMPGLKMVRHSQGRMGMHNEKSLWMPRSVVALEDAILQGRITIDDSDLTKWCAANATLQPDANGNRFFDKRRSRGRIDGIVAIAMAVGLADINLPGAATSIWDRTDMAGVIY